MPTSATNSPLPEALVIAVGPGAPNKDGKIVAPDVKAGDRVLLPGWGGNSIKVGEDVRSSLPETEMFACNLRFCRLGIPHLQRFRDPCKDKGVDSSRALEFLRAEALSSKVSRASFLILSVTLISRFRLIIM